MRPKLLIWDFNGTILDDADLCFAIENEMLAERALIAMLAGRVL